MFWVVIKKDVGFIGILLDDPVIKRPSNLYLEDKLIYNLVGKTYSELNDMYKLNEKFEDTHLYTFFNDKFTLFETLDKQALVFYKFKNK